MVQGSATVVCMGVEQYQSRWAYARCAGMPSQEADKTFFVSSGRPKKIPLHQEFCGSCPIVNFCLSYALVYDEEGIWGGMSKTQRDHLLEKNPDLRDRLIEEAQLQGWYVPRLSVEKLIDLAIQARVKQEVDLIALSEEDEFDLFLGFEGYSPEEYVEQTVSTFDMPEAPQLVGVRLLNSGSDQREDSSESLFGFPNP